MAVLLFPPPSASRSHRAQPARLRRAPRASRVAFGSAERGCALPSHKPSPTHPPINPRSRSRTGDGCFAFPAALCKPQPPGAARPPAAGSTRFARGFRLRRKGLRPSSAQAFPNHPQKSPRTSPQTTPKKPSSSPQNKKISKKQMPQAGTSVLFCVLYRWRGFTPPFPENHN